MADLATTDQNNKVEKKRTHETVLVDFDAMEELPNLDETAEAPVSLNASYWTPTAPNETKRLFFAGFQVDTVQSLQSGEPVELPVVAFIEQVKEKDGSLKVQKLVNGSKRLYATIENAFNSGAVSIGSGLSVKYLGKRKNSTNNFQSDAWEVKPLIRQIKDSAK